MLSATNQPGFENKERLLQRNVGGEYCFFLLLGCDGDVLPKAKAQNAQVFQTRGRTESDTNWDRGGQQGGMLQESTGPDDNILSDAPLNGNKRCTVHGVSPQRAGCTAGKW
jgi:hypothetical protein